jgi:hypothetical protein
MKGVARRSDRLVWLSPRALVAAEHLAKLTGVRIPDLVELLLLELEGGLACDAHAQAPQRAEPSRLPVLPRGRVIPIDRARRWTPRAVPGPPVRARARAARARDAVEAPQDRVHGLHPDRR